ncbi:MAG: hypothetical protein ABJO30_13590 [Hyphomicrobiales bacterium]
MLKPKTYLTTFLVFGLLFSQMASAHTKYEVREIENGGYMLLNTVTGDLNVCERQHDGYRCENFVPLSDELIEAKSTPSDWHSAFKTTFQNAVLKARSGLLFLLAEENFEGITNLSKEAFNRLFIFTDQLKARS